ncbi:c-type cytochrome [Thalassovita aquimarina]|uniref:Cytochrome c n=1 Tax=Thalassovita aquimarina TaxID=2785917 RepID=A0ABS5HSW7_9RHOB|nr:cytochrome c [Thalassovita aquimarina]MBR9651989.1 cytochrome c [Thalassovita aquimarina]
MHKRVLFAAAAVAAIFSGPTLADEMTDPGKTTFMQYCAACHGEYGMGQGAVADVLTTEVPDLTTLAARNDGVFPMLQVIHVIDGRTGVRAHGGPMPIFGALFSDDQDFGPYGGPVYTRGKILSLAYYLESIQK